METREQLGVLWKEYDQLRTQINDHTRHQYTLLAVGLTALTWLLGRGVFGWGFWLLLPLLLGGFGHLFWTSLLNVRRCAYRLIEIEHDVNELSDGELLLQWELRWGCLTLGTWGEIPDAEENATRDIRSWLRAPGNRNALLSWLRQHNIRHEPPVFLYARKFKQERIIAARDLAIPSRPVTE